MTKKLLGLTALAILSLGICGCQLAKGEAAPDRDDRLIGAFVTTEHLELYDMDSQISDSLNRTNFTGDLELDYDAKYDGRLYAKSVTKSSIDSKTGEAHEYTSFEFEGREGVLYIQYLLDDGNGNLSTTTTGDGKVRDTINMFGDSPGLEGTIYYAPQKDLTVYANPVYRTADGSIYTVSNGGMMLDSELLTPASVNLKETYTTDNNGEKTEESFSFKLNIGFRYPPKSYGIIEMDEQNQQVSRRDCQPEDMPERYTPNTDTAYIILEAIADGAEGEVYTREIFQRSDEYMLYDLPQSDGISVANDAYIEWK